VQDPGGFLLRILRIAVLFHLLLASLAEGQPAPRELKRQRFTVSDIQGPPPRVRVGAGFTTTFILDADLAPGGVFIEQEAEHFGKAAVMGRVVMLQTERPPSTDTPLRMTIRYADGQAPTSGTFLLVDDPREVDAQVDVYRRSIPSDILLRELQDLRGRCAATEAGLATLRAQCATGGIAGLLFAGVLTQQGIVGTSVTAVPGATGVSRAERLPVLFRAGTRLAFSLWLHNPRGQPVWIPGTATLVPLPLKGSTAPEARTLPLQMDAGRLAGGETRQVVVEWDEPQGWQGYDVALKLTEQDGDRGLTWARISTQPPGDASSRP
jgi:uncharacterized protein (TIGR02268 family)